MYEQLPLVDPEQDTRIKTHIIPVCATAKDNEFQFYLSQPINVLSNAITYVDLNLRGSDTTPLFNTINSTQVYRYKSTMGSEYKTVTIEPGYYTVDQLLELCNYRFTNKYIIVTEQESSDIHEAAKGHYKPVYGNYVYAPMDITLTTNAYVIFMNRVVNYVKIPVGTYSDIEYFWTSLKMWGEKVSGQSNTVYHTLNYDDEYIYVRNEDVSTCTCLGETMKVLYDVNNTFFFYKDKNGFNFESYFPNFKYSNNYSSEWILQRNYTSRELVNYKVEVLDGFNTFYMVAESTDGDKLKYEFVVSPGVYTEDDFYRYCKNLFDNDHKDGTYIEITEMGQFFYFSPVINNNYHCKYYFTSDDIDHSIFIYRGVLHNIRPNFIYNYYYDYDQTIDIYINKVKSGKQTMQIEKHIPIGIQDNRCESNVYLADFTEASELQEIFGFERSLIIGQVKSDRAVDITRNQGMFICDTNLTDTSQNSLYSFNIQDPVGNNQFHDKTNVLVNKGLSDIQHISFRFRDLSNKYTHINDGALLTGFLELSDRVVKNDDAPTLKKLCLNFQSYDNHFQTTLRNLHLQDKIIKDVLIQNDIGLNNPNENIKDLCTCTINNTYYPSFVFPLNEKLLYYGNINTPISIDQQIDVRFNYPFRGNVVCNICEPIPIDRRFKAYDEVYCDFSKDHVLKFELDKSKKYAYQYITRIQVMSNCGLNDNAGLINANKDCIISTDSGTSQIYPLTLSSYVSPYENIIHIIDASNLPYFYTYGCKYESIKSKISNHIYYCNRQALKLLPKQNEFYLSCYYPCTVIITVSYI